ncbi:sulfate ABC transporter permease subunit CysT [Aureibacillus halotolerans]|uniref:Sulfate transport system permease protein CysT n=1 Tax=Aureibacillus halotolerans TaxID=1508390 RepID=A0A4R6UCN7_9BACI|nr:sulfate ABC transporter permease subunit CysT [Aureibacillus halotolerans]TDQ42883.1 sulfate transport system permease protein [Aureibacillus halotolerans]
MATAARQKRLLPGYGLTLGYTIFYLSVVVLIPLSMVFLLSSTMGWADFWAAVTEPRVLASYRLSFSTALIAGLINIFFGVLIAWVLVRYSFPGRRLIDALVDLPFALPTAVAGIALATLYMPEGWIGQFFPFRIAYSPIGITIALLFIGLPFIVRSVQPVLQAFDQEVEEASASLGASRWQTFRKIILPELTPAILTGFALAFARGVGEYGSVIFIAGNMPFETEISPLVIMTKLEQYDYAGATAVAAVMLMLSFVILLFINVLQWWTRRHAAV